MSHAVDLSFAAIESKRDGKMSGKKSALYRKIMKDHNLPVNSSNNKLNYNIESLVPKEMSHSKPKQNITTSKLTEVKPFDFETNKRALMAVEASDDKSIKITYEPLCLQI
jgi:hypothetical protein